MANVWDPGMAWMENCVATAAARQLLIGVCGVRGWEIVCEGVVVLAKRPCELWKVWSSRGSEGALMHKAYCPILKTCKRIILSCHHTEVNIWVLGEVS